ncbi:MAG: NAD(P)H-hydrate dehydratase [Planctomycetes bacterium]|nr:NAD(P)H-hydrate dehydratase [Planctomycetota bacterium]MBL6997033.1 NAD(P)H-hydrate dehydratase [Phycisphaerales bacterium]
MRCQLPTRAKDGHKGTFGSVCVIGGQRSEDGAVMIGAPTLTANAAMRSGCGKVMLAMPQHLLQTGLSMVPVATGIELPIDEVGRLIPSAAIEAIDRHAAGCRCIAIGPGFGSDWPQQQIIATLLSREDRPIVLDADGLNSFSQLASGQLELRAPTIMTPHVGEFKRLAKAAGVGGDSAEALAQAFGCVVVLKSHTTIVSDGVRTEELKEGGVELATGGSGDVLTGIIAGLIVQYGVDCIEHLFEACVLGTRIHAMAGESFAKEHGNNGMLATDLLTHVPGVIHSLRN